MRSNQIYRYGPDRSQLVFNGPNIATENVERIVKVDRFEKNDVPVCPVILAAKSSILSKPSIGLHGARTYRWEHWQKRSAEETFYACSKAGYSNWPAIKVILEISA